MKEGTEDLITNWSWICPDDTLMCWEKAHLWYIPRKLWMPPSKPGDKDNRIFYARNASTSCDLYKKKMVALGNKMEEEDKNVRKHLPLLKMRKRMMKVIVRVNCRLYL